MNYKDIQDEQTTPAESFIIANEALMDSLAHNEYFGANVHLIACTSALTKLEIEVA